MENFKIKDILLVILFAYLFFVSLISLSVGHNIDYSLRIAIVYAIPVLILFFPIRKLSTRLVLYTIVLFVFSSIFHLAPLEGIASIIYLIFYFPLGLITITLIHFLLISKFNQSTTGTIVILLLGVTLCISFSFISINLIKTKAQDDVKHYAYGWLRCNGNSLSPERFQNICSNLTGKLWESDGIQNVCSAQVESLRTTGVMTKDFQFCSSSRNSDPKPTSFLIASNRFTAFFINYWDLGTAIGLPELTTITPPPILPLPTIHFTINGSQEPMITVQRETIINLAWTSENATSCILNGNAEEVGINSNPSGQWLTSYSFSVIAKVSTVYSVTCDNNHDDRSKPTSSDSNKITVNVN